MILALTDIMMPYLVMAAHLAIVFSRFLMGWWT